LEKADKRDRLVKRSGDDDDDNDDTVALVGSDDEEENVSGNLGSGGGMSSIDPCLPTG
jgi:hypothetical protein